jgi:hypothetical protein
MGLEDGLGRRLQLLLGSIASAADDVQGPAAGRHLQAIDTERRSQAVGLAAGEDGRHLPPRCPERDALGTLLGGVVLDGLRMPARPPLIISEMTTRRVFLAQFRHGTAHASLGAADDLPADGRRVGGAAAIGSADPTVGLQHRPAGGGGQGGGEPQRATSRRAVRRGR